MALGKEFGSKKSKAAIQSQLSSQVDTKALESLASTIYENIKVATENIPSQGTIRGSGDVDGRCTTGGSGRGSSDSKY